MITVNFSSFIFIIELYFFSWIYMIKCNWDSNFSEKVSFDDSSNR